LKTEKHILFVFIFFTIANSHSQTGINVESLRETTNKKWIGSIGLNTSLIKNINDIFWISNNAQIQC